MGAVDPYAVLGVHHGAEQAEIHAAYRAAVRRTHPDAGGTAAAFEAVQEAYETLRDRPAPRPRTTRPQTRGTRGEQGRESGRAQTPRPAAGGAAGGRRGGDAARGDPSDGDAAYDGRADAQRSRMDELLAESRRLETEARRLAGLPPRGEAPSPDGASADTVSAILRDAGGQLRAAADVGVRELRRRVRRLL